MILGKLRSIDMHGIIRVLQLCKVQPRVDVWRECGTTCAQNEVKRVALQAVRCRDQWLLSRLSEWVVSWENNGSWHRKGSSVLKVGEGCSFSFSAIGSPASCWNFTRGVFGLRRLMEELLAVRGHYTLLSEALASSLICPVGSHSPVLLSPLVYQDH